MQENTEHYARVYDIEVEYEHEYFANNILVHNCSDTMDYFLCYYFKEKFVEFQHEKKKKKRVALRAGDAVNF